MSTEVDICNLALIEIGSENFISSLSANNTREEIVLGLLYEEARDFLLSSFTWNFARARSILSGTTAPEFGYASAFQLPADCLRAIKDDYNDAQFVIEGDKLLTDATAIRLLYIKKVTDTATFSSFFKQCLVKYLASRLAEVILSDAKRAANLYTIYLDTFKKAKRLDSMEGTPQTFKKSHYRKR